jgi:hypothetical protein
MSKNYREQMEARGWMWDDELRMFLALGARDRQDCPIINLRVDEWAPGVWMAHYGVPGIGYERFIGRPTPMAAADEAEAWLRNVLAPLRLPWLNVQVTP